MQSPIDVSFADSVLSFARVCWRNPQAVLKKGSGPAERAIPGLSLAMEGLSLENRRAPRGRMGG